MPRIRTLFIFEILGKPAGHIKSTLESMVDKLGEQKGLEIVRKVVHEPKLIEKDDNIKDKIEKAEMENYIKEEFYNTFAEVEIETENINLIMSIVLNMLPAHVEILEPTEMRVSNTDISGLMTELAVKMHKYDEVTKILMLEKNFLEKRLKEMEDKLNNFEGEVKGEDKVEGVVEESKKEDNSLDIGVEKDK